MSEPDENMEPPRLPEDDLDATVPYPQLWYSLSERNTELALGMALTYAFRYLANHVPGAPLGEEERYGLFVQVKLADQLRLAATPHLGLAGHRELRQHAGTWEGALPFGALEWNVMLALYRGGSLGNRYSNWREGLPALAETSVEVDGVAVATVASGEALEHRWEDWRCQRGAFQSGIGQLDLARFAIASMAKLLPGAAEQTIRDMQLEPKYRRPAL